MSPTLPAEMVWSFATISAWLARNVFIIESALLWRSSKFLSISALMLKSGVVDAELPELREVQLRERQLLDGLATRFSRSSESTSLSSGASIVTLAFMRSSKERLAATLPRNASLVGAPRKLVVAVMVAMASKSKASPEPLLTQKSNHNFSTKLFNAGVMASSRLMPWHCFMTDWTSASFVVVISVAIMSATSAFMVDTLPSLVVVRNFSANFSMYSSMDVEAGIAQEQA